MTEYLLYTREDSGRELPGSGALLLPGKVLKATDFHGLAEVLVQRGDCVYCDADGKPEAAPADSKPDPTPAPTPAPAPEVEVAPAPEAEAPAHD